MYSNCLCTLCAGSAAGQCAGLPYAISQEELLRALSLSFRFMQKGGNAVKRERLAPAGRSPVCLNHFCLLSSLKKFSAKGQIVGGEMYVGKRLIGLMPPRRGTSPCKAGRCLTSLIYIVSTSKSESISFAFSKA